MTDLEIQIQKSKVALAKHADHDQKSHGNRGGGSSDTGPGDRVRVKLPSSIKSSPGTVVSVHRGGWMKIKVGGKVLRVHQSDVTTGPGADSFLYQDKTGR